MAVSAVRFHHMRIGLVVLMFVWVACAGFGTGEVAPAAPAPTTTTTTTTTSTSTSTTTTTTTIPTFTLTGHVRDVDGRPLGGSTVTVSGVETVVGPDGWFLVTEVPFGEVVVSRPGWQTVLAPWDGSATPVDIRLQPVRVRALRVSAWVAERPEAYSALLALADETVINALVFDTKQEGGVVLYETAVAEANDIGAVQAKYDPAAHLAAAKERGLYTITRIVTFEDGIRVRARPELKMAGEWIDPRIREGWEYPIALGEEACSLGFHEIQFDYVRFPAGKTAAVSGQRDLSQEERVGVIRDFLQLARSRIHPLGCAVSADIFGIVVSTPDDQGIGQMPEEVSLVVDVVSPMVYPSHYSLGWLGFPDPNDHPYSVTADALDDGTPRLASPLQMRPWLQAFWWTDAEIKESIRAAEERGTGWMLWNAAGNYSHAALPTAEEIERWNEPPTPTPTSTSIPASTSTTEGGG